MATPAEPTVVDLVETLFEVTERLVERDHLLDQHRGEDGERPQFAACPADPCVTWRPALAMLVRFQARRLP